LSPTAAFAGLALPVMAAGSVVRTSPWAAVLLVGMFLSLLRRDGHRLK
jgi:hypothetical protein